MNVFADLHHGGLFYSLKLLFEDRLGFSLYRPIGMDWFNAGYWKIAEPYNNALPTVSQFLSTDFIPADGSSPINNNPQVTVGGSYRIFDPSFEYNQKAITLEAFKLMEFDLVIASIPAHVDAYKRLIKESGSKAKLVYHIGNIDWHQSIPWDWVDGVMASVKEFDTKSQKPCVFYRQEFSLEVFRPSPVPPDNVITSFVNCLPEAQRFYELERLLSEYTFKSYGITCRDGICTAQRDIASHMQTSKFGYHYKPYGDGFGHVIHNWAAVGKPVLVNLADYKDKLAGELMEDGVTCIDISNMSPVDIAARVSVISNDDYTNMCCNVSNRFKNVVNFDTDQIKVKEFIDAVLQ